MRKHETLGFKAGRYGLLPACVALTVLMMCPALVGLVVTRELWRVFAGARIAGIASSGETAACLIGGIYGLLLAALCLWVILRREGGHDIEEIISALSRKRPLSGFIAFWRMRSAVIDASNASRGE